MTDHRALAQWIAGYRRAWESNAPADIVALFTEDAEYRTEPYSEPWTGHAEILAEWLSAADEPGETSFEWTTLVRDEHVAVVEATTVYARGPRYRNLWVIRLAPDGRASAFTEWWMEEPADG
ncbi:nuclear transport factor 2 family protein [Cryobacterium melibiosiphilum]|uniref:Nuclear transport factor 2 family protein n=1 Tax=Cryobacterium melibiosiphilum TaxID=995039 RepID=A0A3A5MDH8_9MICO|nr:nuclear transport factor 2 family protein [Cryobacterium melibiosiphilum]RJT87215.1 nuclear transport factor 2 family protein [Cryobacterium melibiosiphilum]